MCCLFDFQVSVEVSVAVEEAEAVEGGVVGVVDSEEAEAVGGAEVSKVPEEEVEGEEDVVVGEGE